MRVAPLMLPQSLSGFFIKNMLKSGRGTCCAALAERSAFRVQVRPPRAAAAAGRNRRSLRTRPWQRLFCSISNEQPVPTQVSWPVAAPPTPQPAQQPAQSHPEGLNGSVKLDPSQQLALEEGTPLRHSNPDIQVLLDRYTRLCENEVDPSVLPVFGPCDRRSPSRAVFSNTNVDLSRVKVVGFDYDYTLATCEFFSQSDAAGVRILLCRFCSVVVGLN